MKYYALLLSIVFVGLSGDLFSQDVPGGVSTGAAKVYTSRRTTGILEKNAPAVYADTTSGSGIEKFRCVSGSLEKEYILEVTGCNAAVLDFDNDGKLDIYLLSGSSIKSLSSDTAAPPAALFKNLGGLKFVDVTKKAGVANERWGMGVSVGDYNNDGFPDMFVANYGVSRLYKNNGNGTFTDVAKEVGVDINGWFTGSTFGDFDKDGRLDLFVPAYLDFDITKLPPSPLAAGKDGILGTNFCQFRGQAVMCGPRGLRGAKDRLFRQKKDGTFEDVGKALGVIDDGNYYGFSSVFVDIDDDRDLDLLVVNDSTPKQLYLNDGKGNFEESGYPSGIALNENGREQAGMGLGVGDYDNDGRVDFYVTNFSDDSNTLYRNDGDGNFTDITVQAGLGETTIPFLGWGTAFLDFDNDGWKDVIIGNGHVYPIVDKYQWGTSLAQQILLFRNGAKDKNGRIQFSRVGAAPETALAQSYNVRGLAYADFDDDGKLDIVVNNIDSTPAILRNVDQSTGNWIRLKLVGNVEKGSPRDAVGSTVFITSGGQQQRFDLVSGGGFASQSEQIVHFGLGASKVIDDAYVVWPNGEKEKLSLKAINRVVTVTQK